MSRPASLDLTRRAFVHARGDIVLIGSWFRGDETDDNSIEPCLVLMPRYRPLRAPLPPVVLLSAAYLWADPRYAVAKAKDYLELLGITESLADVSRVIEVITDHLRDLIAMPPRPGVGMLVVADATISTGDGKTQHAEILRHL